MTLHLHKVHTRTWVNTVNDGCQPLPVPEGWQIADGNADDIRVCATHPWQANYLVFANGDAYGTGVLAFRHARGESKGVMLALRSLSRCFLWRMTSVSGVIYKSDQLIQDAEGVRAKESECDVLLRNRS